MLSGCELARSGPVVFRRYSPEVNPAEAVWRFRKNGGLAHRHCRTVDEIIDRCYAAWQSRIDDPGRIRSLCSFDWVMGKPATS